MPKDELNLELYEGLLSDRRARLQTSIEECELRIAEITPDYERLRGFIKIHGDAIDKYNSEIINIDKQLHKISETKESGKQNAANS